ncbi:MAG: amidase [Pseudomonadota bacterium]
MTDPANLTASEAARAIAAGTLSPAELLDAGLARAAKFEPQVQAFAHLDPAQARDALTTLRPGPLHGLPLAVKDMIDTAHMPTQHNSPIYEGHQPAQDAAVVTIARETGALILGKTDTHEFAAGGRLPATTNPHNAAHTPGGSSSGSAAAVAAGFAPLAFGTQTAGSMLRPASFCGIFGMKPTYGTVSREGAKLYAISLDTIGWYGRSVPDLGLMAYALRAIRRPLDFSRSDVKGRRIGLYEMPGSESATADARQALEDAARLLENAGATVTRLVLTPEFDTLAEAQNTIMRGEGRAAFLDLYLARPDALAQDFRDRVEDADDISFADLRAAHDHAALCRPAFERAIANLDGVLAIGAPGEAPRSLRTTGNSFFQRMWSVLQVPALALPGFAGVSGMPIGVQLIGPRYGDADLLELGHAVAHALGRPRVDPVP